MLGLLIWLVRLIGLPVVDEAGIVFRSRRVWDKVIRRRVSIEKARRILGYGPKTRMDEGLAAVYRWFKENWDNIQRSASF